MIITEEDQIKLKDQIEQAFNNEESCWQKIDDLPKLKWWQSTWKREKQIEALYTYAMYWQNIHRQLMDKYRNNETIIKSYIACTCMGCSNKFMGPKPQMCCSGRECGCMGQPIEPVVCSYKCYDTIINKYK